MTENNGIAVIIVSHNYGKYLQECITSVRQQSIQPAELIVIDDCSTDNTTEIAGKNELACYNVNFQNCYLSRQYGYDKTNSPFIVFLDADDILAPTHLEECLKQMTLDNRYGIVTSRIRLFGTRAGEVDHKPVNLERSNWIHAGSMVRRAALSGALAYDQPPCGLGSHEDWFVWRPVVRAGWRVATTGSPTYLYRQHAESLMHGPMRLGTYYERAALHLQPITLVLPICRELYFDRLTAWVKKQKQFNEIIVIDSADTESLRQRIKEWIATLEIENVIHIKRISSEGLADMNRSLGNGVYQAVQLTMPRIYKHMRRATNEYIMIVEDDVLPPDDAVDKLLQGFDQDVAGMTGVVPSRYQKGFAIAGTEIGKQDPLKKQTGVEQMAFSGFGCLLLRRSAMLEVAPFNSGGQGNFDIEFWRDLLARNWLLKMNYSVRCQHADQGC